MREVPFWLMGIGGVGSTLVRMVRDPIIRETLATRAGIRFVPILLADSRAALTRAGGLSDADLDAVLEYKANGESLMAFSGAAVPLSRPEDVLSLLAKSAGTSGTIGVDATSSPHMTSLWKAALDAGASVVLANKKPLAGRWEDFLALTSSRRCRHEATVGAGLPVIATLYSLLDSGDSVTSIQGCFSGTLGYICTALNRGEPFSVAVRAAKEAGFTEPDPREDLSGMDVGRKALILSRMRGRRLELDDLLIEPLMPAEWAHISLAEFMERLPEADAEMAHRVAQARARGHVLHYVADLSPEVPTIGLREVERDSPIGRLVGTDNIIVFHTLRYCQSPLVIQGPGAGREVTAAGILSDMISLAREAFL